MGPKKIKAKADTGKEDAKIRCMLTSPFRCLEYPELENFANQRYYTLTCNLNCAVSFHAGCWRAYKDHKKLKTEKEAIDLACITPDCPGTIVFVYVVKENGDHIKIEKGCSFQPPIEAERRKVTAHGAVGGESPRCKEAENELTLRAELLHVKELKHKCKTMAHELKESKVKISKLTKDIEKLTGDKSSLMLKKTQSDETIASLTERIHELELNQTSSKDEIKSRYEQFVAKLQRENQTLKQEVALGASERAIMREEMVKLREEKEVANDYFTRYNTFKLIHESDIAQIKANLLRAQVNIEKHKIQFELKKTNDNIQALRNLLSWYQPNQLHLRPRVSGTWDQFKTLLEGHVLELQHYKGILSQVLDRCDETHADCLRVLKSTGVSPEFVVKNSSQQPQITEPSFLDDFLILIQEYVLSNIFTSCERVSMTNSFSINSSSGSINSNTSQPSQAFSFPSVPNAMSVGMALVVSDIRVAFPWLTINEASALITRVVEHNPSIRADDIVRLVGRAMSDQDWNKYARENITVSIQSSKEEASKAHDECSICLEVMRPKNSIALDPCGHRFHPDCIKLWFKEKRDCPFCRKFTILQEEFPAMN